MRSINRVVLMGHLAADPEARQTKEGIHVVSFPMATNKVLNDGNGGKKEIVDFHRIVAWRNLADISVQYLKKGMAVYIEGRLINRSFDDKNGNRHYRTEIVADTLNILTWKRTTKGGELGIKGLQEEPEKEEVLEDALATVA